MKIWELVTDDNCLGLSMGDSSPRYIREGFNGQRMNEDWTPPQMFTRRKGRKSDCAEFLLDPIFNSRSIKILNSIIADKVEYLPIIHDNYDLYFINVIHVIDIVDMTNPVEKRLIGGYSKEYTYIHPEKISPDDHIFKIPQRKSRVYVSDVFKEMVETEKIKGILIY